MIKVGIIGGAGYTGGEAIRLLINHLGVELAWVQSSSNAGAFVSDVHTDLVGDLAMRFAPSAESEVDVLFICSGHGEARKWLTDNELPASTRVIDLSQDFRLRETSTLGVSESSGIIEARQLPPRGVEGAENCHPAASASPSRHPAASREISSPRSFVYGLPELNRSQIQAATNIANPGCFATCIQLGLLPLAAGGFLADDVNVCATTGSTGAGQKPTPSTHFSWRANNLSTYKEFEHQHLLEIGETLRGLQPAWAGSLDFVPARGAFTRGIFASLWTRCELSEERVKELYRDFYADAAFTFEVDRAPDLKQVVNTNKCLVHVARHDDKVLITSAIDNLLKGASGQAIQNMNLMSGLDERAGLRLKALAF